MSEEVPDDERWSEIWPSLYQNTTQELHNTKQGSWRNVVFLGAYTVFITLNIDHLDGWRYICFFVFQILIVLVYVYFVNEANQRIKKYRNRLKNLYKINRYWKMSKQFDHKILEKKIMTTSDMIVFWLQLIYGCLAIAFPFIRPLFLSN